MKNFFQSAGQGIKEFCSNKVCDLLETEIVPSEPSLPIALCQAIGSCDESVMITDYDLDNQRILCASKGHQKLTGYSPIEIIGRTPQMFRGKNTNKKIVEEMKKAMHDDGYWIGNLTNYTKSGDEIEIQLMIFPILHDNKYYYVSHQKLLNNKSNIDWVD